jgi:hypothetical protein
MSGNMNRAPRPAKPAELESEGSESDARALLPALVAVLVAGIALELFGVALGMWLLGS